MYIHTHTHTLTAQQVAGDAVLCFQSGKQFNSEIFKMRLIFPLTGFSIWDKVRFPFCNIIVSMLLEDYLLLYPHNVLSGIHVINKTQFLPF
jgi:hypothetical protein